MLENTLRKKLDKNKKKVYATPMKFKIGMIYRIFTKDGLCNILGEPLQAKEAHFSPEIVTKVEYYRPDSKAIKRVHTSTSKYRTTQFEFELV